MGPETLTRVRVSEAEAHDLLQLYIFSGIYGGPRVPRGIEPAVVSRFIRDRLGPRSSSSAYEHTLDVMRFYERYDAAPKVLETLLEPPLDAEGVMRCAFGVQAGGDFGVDEELPTRADQYFDEVLAPHRAAVQVFPLLLETRVVLAPVGSFDVIEARIDQAVQDAKAAARDAASLMTYDRLAAVQRNDLPRAKFAAGRKADILALEPEPRRSELVKVYLGQADISNAYTETWAGRLLRREVMAGAAPPVHSALSRPLDRIAAKPELEPGDAFVVTRAAQAILYLEGTLTAAQQKLYAKAKDPVMSFLWDDLPADEVSLRAPGA